MQFSEELSSFYHNMIALNLTLAVIPERRTNTKKHIEVGILAVPRLTTHLPLKRQPDMRAVPMAIAIISKAPSRATVITPSKKQQPRANLFIIIVMVPITSAGHRCSNASETALFKYRFLEAESQNMRCYHRLPHLANTVTPVREHFLDVVVSRLGAYTHGGTITLRPKIHSACLTRSDKRCRPCSPLIPGCCDWSRPLSSPRPISSQYVSHRYQYAEVASQDFEAM